MEIRQVFNTLINMGVGRYACFMQIYVYTDVGKVVGNVPLKREKPTMVTEITWNWQK